MYTSSASASNSSPAPSLAPASHSTTQTPSAFTSSSSSRPRSQSESTAFPFILTSLQAVSGTPAAAAGATLPPYDNLAIAQFSSTPAFTRQTSLTRQASLTRQPSVTRLASEIRLLEPMTPSMLQRLSEGTPMLVRIDSSPSLGSESEAVSRWQDVQTEIKYQALLEKAPAEFKEKVKGELRNIYFVNVINRRYQHLNDILKEAFKDTNLPPEIAAKIEQQALAAKIEQQALVTLSQNKQMKLEEASRRFDYYIGSNPTDFLTQTFNPETASGLQTKYQINTEFFKEKFESGEYPSTTKAQEVFNQEVKNHQGQFNKELNSALITSQSSDPTTQCFAQSVYNYIQTDLDTELLAQDLEHHTRSNLAVGIDLELNSSKVKSFIEERTQTLVRLNQDKLLNKARKDVAEDLTRMKQEYVGGKKEFLESVAAVPLRINTSESSQSLASVSASPI